MSVDGSPRPSGWTYGMVRAAMSRRAGESIRDAAPRRWRPKRTRSRLRCCLASASTIFVLAATAGWGVLWRADKTVEAANRLLAKGKPKEALARYEEAEKRLGRRPRLDYNQGLAYYLLSNLKKAQDAFLAAAGSGDEEVRRRAFFALANTLFRLAEPLRAEAQKATDQFAAGRKQLATLPPAAPPGASPSASTAQRCKAMKALIQLADQVGSAWRETRKGFDKAYAEYRRLLVKQPDFFDAKWNLELSLRRMAEAKRQAAEADRAKRELETRFAKECDRKDQKKQDQKKQDQKKQDQKKQDQKKQSRPREQKPLTKEDIARQQAAKELDKLERRQRERDRRRFRAGAGQRPTKDW